MTNSSAISAIDQQIERIAEANEVTIEEAAKMFVDSAEHVTKLNDQTTDGHHWIDRGMKFSCEGGSHPHHETYKRR